MAQFGRTLEYLRLGLLIISSIILSIGFIIPFVQTFLPYKYNVGEPSWALTSRIWVRVLFFSLALYNALMLAARMFSWFDVTGYSLTAIAVRNMSAPVYIGIVALIIYTWIKHPDGIRGL
jgi:hypothetical protein